MKKYTKKELANMYCRKMCETNNNCEADGMPPCGELMFLIDFAEENDLIKEPEYKYYVKSKEEIQESLKRLGYEEESCGDWIHPFLITWNRAMWNECGQEAVVWVWDYMPEWLEKREC